jgi:hypothetical protein
MQLSPSKLISLGIILILFSILAKLSRGTSVIIMVELLAGQWRNRDSVPGGCKIFLWPLICPGLLQDQVSLKSDKNNRCFTWRITYIYENILLNSFQNEKCFRQTSRENQNTHFVFSNFFPRKGTVYEIMCKKWYSQKGNRWQYNTAHALCVLRN